MKEILIKEETIRRYLLGDLEENARAALEDRFLSDAEIFERIEDAENDLVDDYVGEKLDVRERKSFENYYLALSENRAKVETARFLRRIGKEDTKQVSALIVEKIGFWQSIQNFFASFRFAPVAVSAFVLLVVVGGLWFAFRSNQNNEIAFSPSPQPTIQTAQPSPSVAPQTNENANKIAPSPSPTVQQNVNAAPKETPRAVEPKVQPTPKSVPQTVTLALVAGLLRGGGEANKLVLPKNAGQVRLSFDLSAKNYKKIEARIETAAGEKIWSGKIKQASGRAVITLPAEILADEDYLLIISGANETGERKDFAQFYFNAERK